MKTKKANVELKHLDCEQPFEVKTGGGRDVFIEGYGNKATVDRGDEFMATDAWELDNFKKNPVILFNHGKDKLGGTPIGKAVEIRQTDEGLFLKVKLSNSSAPDIQMIRDLVEERILKAFSVGFNPKVVDTVELEGKSVRRISKAELYEVSVVGVPMNQDSLFEISGKSVHEVKGLVLKARGAEKAARIEEILGKCVDRHAGRYEACKALNMEWKTFLAMLAGDVDMDERVEAVMTAAVKKVNLRAALDSALESLDDGTNEAEVRAALVEALKETDGEETEDEEEGERPDETDGEGAGEEGATDEGGEEEDEELKKQKASFQECVNATVPKLLAEGMERDQAVAAAISKCQESGKCALTPESKLGVYGAVFKALDAGSSAPISLLDKVEFKAEDDGGDGEEGAAEGDDAAGGAVEDPEVPEDKWKALEAGYVELVDLAIDKLDADESLTLVDAIKSALKEKYPSQEDQDAIEAGLQQFAKDGFENAEELDAFFKRVVNEAESGSEEGKGGPGSGIQGHRTPKKPGKGGRFRRARLSGRSLSKKPKQAKSKKGGLLGRIALGVGTVVLGLAAVNVAVNVAVGVGLGITAIAAKAARVARAASGKQVDDAAQSTQQPTTAVQTSSTESDFGSPYLEVAKQTNVLLGSLINEIQKLSSKMDGLVPKGSVSSSEDQTQEGGDSSESGKALDEEYARKKIEEMSQRLARLGV